VDGQATAAALRSLSVSAGVLPVFCLGRRRAAWLASSGLIDAHQRRPANSAPSVLAMSAVLSPVIGMLASVKARSPAPPFFNK